ncbi:MAG: C40 family peptidase [Roseburia sp.]|nr:C40 family peptidase [Roseburia sp.]
MAADTQTADVNAAQAYGYTNLGVASVDGNLNVRESASTEASVVGKMPNNAGCEILGVEGEWTKISSGKVEGYVKSEYLLSGDAALARAEEVKQTIAKVTTTTLYVREQPNTDCTIITMMPEGEELEVLEVLDGWVKINVDSDEGYVSSEYVEISTELLKAMTMTEIRYGQGVSDVRVSLVQYATQFVGNPYVWGGTSLTNGADCSGFVLSVFANYGISLPHSSRAQAGCGTSISASEAQPGDLFFYSNGGGINHVAIYIGNGQVVHASSPKSGIKISNAYYRTPAKVVRIINN